MPDRSPSQPSRRRPWAAAAIGAALAGAGLGIGVLVGSPGAPAVRPPADPGRLPAAAPVDAPPAVRAPWEPGAPRRLSLPSLGIDVPVVPVEAPGRRLVPPRDPWQLGWWADGARPGDRGSAIVAGHTVHGSAEGALDHIERLQAGDPVVVKTRRAQLSYAVASVRVLDKDQLAARAERLFDQEGPSRLVLVTCENWDGTQFLSNVVVVARPVGAR